MKIKLEWPFNLMADINTFIDSPYNKLAEDEKGAPKDLLAATVYVLAVIKDSSECVGKIRGADAVLKHYRDGVSIREIGESFDVSRQVVYSNIEGVLSCMARCELYHSLLKRGLAGHIKAVSDAAFEKGRAFGYTDGLYDGKQKADAAEYERGYNDGTEGLKSRAESKIDWGKPIEDCGLSSRAYIHLKRRGINYLKQLRNITRDELMSIRGMGAKTADGIMEYVNKLRAIDESDDHD